MPQQYVMMYFYAKRSFILVVLIILCLLSIFMRRNDHRIRRYFEFVDQTSRFENDELECSENDLLRRKIIFEDIRSNDYSWSSCYTNHYIEKLYLADMNRPDRQDKLFFDVGANKGYTIALWLSTWMPQLNISQKNVYELLKEQLKVDDCGACLDCRESVLNISQKNNNNSSSSTIPTRITIHAFEPIRDTYEMLLQLRLQFNLSDVFIHNLALTNSTGVKKMVKCAAGKESCGLVLTQSNPADVIVDVNTMRLDDFVEKYQIEQDIDLLKIDTEGADALVLDGARKLFAKERVRMLIFENHQVGMWQTINLTDVLQSLEKQGFICHLIGRTGMIRMTKCWLPIYDLKWWSNVLCVHRRQERLRHFLNQLLI